MCAWERASVLRESVCYSPKVERYVGHSMKWGSVPKTVAMPTLG